MEDNEKVWQENGRNYKNHITSFIANKKQQSIIVPALNRGVKQEHLEEFIENEPLLDFDIDNLIKVMIREQILCKDNGYDM